MKNVKVSRKNRLYALQKHSLSFLAHGFLAILSVLWLLPIAWLVLQSLRKEGGAYTSYVIPKIFTLENYINLFTKTQLFNFPRWFLNTFFVALLTALITTIIVLTTSYAFSRLRFKMRKNLMNILLVLGMFPGFMSMTAIYHIIKMMGLAQSLWALVLVYSGGAAMGYYICKGFFDTIPFALDESAMLEGASKNLIFWKIILPMSSPIIIYTVLISFIAPWVDFIFVSVIMRDNYNNYTVALGLYQMITKENIGAYFTQFCAGSVLIAIPITLLFIFMQNYYVSGVTSGAVKG